MRPASSLAGVLVALPLRKLSRTGRPGAGQTKPAEILNDVAWFGTLSAFTFVSGFGFAAGAKMSSGDLRAFAIAVTIAMLGVSALAFARLGLRLAAFSSFVAGGAKRRYPVANDP